MTKVTYAQPLEAVETGAAHVSKGSRVKSYTQSLKPGDKVKATFRFKTDFGAFMWVNGIAHGLLHWTDMPGVRTERQAYLDKLRPGDDLLAEVVSVDIAKARVRLSMVAAERRKVFAELKRGSIVQGTIGGVIAIGAYVKFGAISGFLHVKELLGERSERDAALAAMKKGDKLELAIIDANQETGRMYLSQRRVPIAKLTPGQEVRGPCVRILKHLVVLQLDGGVLGYLHRLDDQTLQLGQITGAKVKSVDMARNTVKLV